MKSDFSSHLKENLLNTFSGLKLVYLFENGSVKFSRYTSVRFLLSNALILKPVQKRQSENLNTS